MIPESRLSTEPVPSDFIGARALPSPSDLEDFEDGGVALQDPSQGAQVQVWRAWADGGTVYLESESGQQHTLFTRAVDIAELSLSFDQNMNAAVAFVEGVVAWIWWFDAVTSQQIFTMLGPQVKHPKVFLDDKHPLGLSSSDIILAYQKGHGLYFRAQRDRFGVEYLLANNVQGRLIKIGMNTGNRLQFMISADGLSSGDIDLP